MEWTLDRNRAICPQLCEQICVMIASGEFPAHSKLPSVRDIALSAGVNPNTVQKSLETLSEQGIVYAERGSGWFVADKTDAASKITSNVVRLKTAEYFEQMKALGFDEAMVKKYVEEWNE